MISVVLTTYNGSAFILQQLESIRMQTLMIDEVLIFDDLSKDDTYSKVVSYIQEKNLLNWKIFLNLKSKGWMRNFVEGLKESRGDIVFLCDQDDIWKHDKAEIMVSFMKNKEIYLLASNYTILYSGNNFSTEKEAELKKSKNNHQLIKMKVKSKNFYVRRPGCTYCISRSLVDIAIDLWYDKVPHDALLWMVALYNNGLYNINIPLIEWRRHSSNTTSNKHKKTLSERLENCLATYATIDKVFNLGKYTCSPKFVLKSRKFMSLRILFFQKKNFFVWLKLALFYSGFYVSKRSILGDLFLCYMGEYQEK